MEDESTWQVIGQMIGAGTVGALLLRVVDRIFNRIDRSEDVASGLRVEMIQRLHTLSHDLDAAEESNRQLYERLMRFEVENRTIRQRFTNLVDWIVKTRKLAAPEWVYEVVHGPTEDEPLRPWQTRKTE